MTATYSHTDDSSGEEWVVEVEFTISPGEPRTFEYPGDPAVVEDMTFAVKSRDTAGGDACPVTTLDDARFTALVESDDDLRRKIEEVCFEHAQAMWELSQCDD
jgi:hypothetical protein